MSAGFVEKYIPLGIVLLVAFTLHEFAHAWVAYKLGDDTAEKQGRVTLNPIVHLDLMGTLCFLITGFFGWAKPVPVNPRNFAHPRRDDFLVSFAGPLSNIFLSLLGGLVLYTCIQAGIFPKADLFTGTRALQEGLFKPSIAGLATEQALPIMLLTWKVTHMMILLNLYLAFFNLLPVFPLDGSHIVKSLLPLNQAFRFHQFNQAYGSWILIGLILAGPLTNNRIDPVHWLMGAPSTFLYKLIAFSWM